jgi:RNA polymerase sigma-70 factor, ECF subfamily
MSPCETPRVPIPPRGITVSSRYMTSVEEDAYEEEVVALRGELLAHCHRMLGSRHDAEDALQEALIRAWRGLPAFEGRSSLRSWLYRIATNTSLDQLQRRPEQIVPIDDAQPTDPHDHPDAQVERRESLGSALTVARELPASQRSVLFLRAVLGYSAAETADALGTSVPAVNSSLQRARAAIRDRVDGRRR